MDNKVEYIKLIKMCGVRYKVLGINKLKTVFKACSETTKDKIDKINKCHSAAMK